MAKVNFPNSPSDGDTFSSGGTTYTYNTAKGYWDGNTSTPGDALTISLEADVADGELLVLESDQWVNKTTNEIGLATTAFVQGLVGSNVANSVYSTIDDLPLSGVVAGAQAYVSATNRLYLWSGAGWYNIALINTAPTITTEGDASYILALDGTATVVTLEANDPEGIPITWSYAVTTGSLGSTATVSQADNVFTITPSTSSADQGTFTITFTASDGVNLAASASQFSLTFEHELWDNVLLLLGARTDQTPDIYDQKANATLSDTTAFYEASTTQTKYSTASIAAVGADTAFIGIEAPQVSLSGDFTVELWHYLDSTIPAGYAINHWNGNYLHLLGSGPGINFGDGGYGSRLGFSTGGGSGNQWRIALDKATAADAWQHYALVRHNGTIKLYHNGVRQNIANHTSTNFQYTEINNTTTWTFSPKIASYGNIFETYIEDFQIMNVAKYTANFTPPSQALSLGYQGEI